MHIRPECGGTHREGTQERLDLKVNWPEGGSLASICGHGLWGRWHGPGAAHLRISTPHPRHQVLFCLLLELPASDSWEHCACSCQVSQPVVSPADLNVVL